MNTRIGTQTTEELQGRLDALQFLFLQLLEEVFRDRPEAGNRMFSRLLIVLDENNLGKLVSVRSRNAEEQCEASLSEAVQVLMKISEARDRD